MELKLAKRSQQLSFSHAFSQLSIFNCWRLLKHRKTKVELDPIPIGRGAVKIFVEGKGTGQPASLLLVL